MKCPRCSGFMMRDEDMDASCVRCGAVVVLMRRQSAVPESLKKREGTFQRTARING